MFRGSTGARRFRPYGRNLAIVTNCSTPDIVMGLGALTGRTRNAMDRPRSTRFQQGPMAGPQGPPPGPPGPQCPYDGYYHTEGECQLKARAQQAFDQNGGRACFYCGRANHHVRECRFVPGARHRLHGKDPVYLTRTGGTQILGSNATEVQRTPPEEAANHTGNPSCAAVATPSNTLPGPDPVQATLTCNYSADDSSTSDDSAHRTPLTGQTPCELYPPRAPRDELEKVN